MGVIRNNLALGPAAGTNFVLDRLRAQTLPETDFVPEREIAAGVRFLLDPNAAFEGRVSSPRGRLIEIEGNMTRPARWFGLHIALDARDLSEREIVGFAARLAAPQPLSIRACLRSGGPAGFSDSFYDKPLLAEAGPVTHLDVLETGRQGLSDEAQWRELVLFLPTRSFHLTLHDLRMFII